MSLSPTLRARITRSVEEVKEYRLEKNIHTSSGMRIEIWSKAIPIVMSAPIFGHGTGSTAAQYRQSAERDVAAPITGNPHNQILGVLIQLGIFGAAVLASMWAAHLALLRSPGAIAWIGTTVVLQNIVSSLFNTHLFDFFHGWPYVFGFGVIGGMVLRQAGGYRREA